MKTTEYWWERKEKNIKGYEEHDSEVMRMVVVGGMDVD